MSSAEIFTQIAKHYYSVYIDVICKNKNDADVNKNSNHHENMPI